MPPTNYRATTVTEADSSVADRINDLIIAAGLVSAPGKRVVNALLDLAVRHEKDGAVDRYLVYTGHASARNWEPAFIFVYGPKGRETLRYDEGDWEGRLLDWAFEGAGEPVIEAAAIAAPSQQPIIPNLTPANPVPEDEIIDRIIRPSDQEAVKALAWRHLLSPEVRLEDRAACALLLLRSWFDRSLWAHLQAGRRYTTHPDFATYCAMVLHHRGHCRTTFGDDAVTERLIDVYGTEEGMDAGSGYWQGETFKRIWAERHATLRPFGLEDLPSEFPSSRS